ncbi:MULTISPECIES: hypothetical protein [unclassified Kitasatospora]|uniref:hypothetical protein n=1 Tax=unclassified Kitasatospora TaxID=2633591 RepID=UPI002476F223|nr:hypothetical protein [Kitasatospora sp. MAP12-44]
MTDRTETSPAPMAALGELLAWLNTLDNRVTWRASRLAREMELIEAERALSQAQYGRRKPAAPEQIVAWRERVAEAKGRLGLAELTEEFIERTRLRIAATAHQTSLYSGSDEALRSLAVQVNLGTRSVIAALADEEPNRPAEVYRNAKAALDDLTSGYRAVRATGAASDLRAWAEALELALDVTRLTAARA